MVTSSETLRRLIHKILRESKTKETQITEIYDFVRKNCNFDEEDLIPPNLYGKPVKEPRWKRNVRNVLKSESDNGKIIWRRKGVYSYIGKPEVFAPFSFEVLPKKTFFGLDKGKSHCFTIPKIHYLTIRNIFKLNNNKLQQNIQLTINKKKYPALIRLINMNRSKTRKLKKVDLPKREVYQISWIHYSETQNIIKNKFKKSYKFISNNQENISEIAKFTMIGDNNFVIESIYSQPKVANKEGIKIDSINCNIPSSFVNRYIKLANDRGNGEAKLYIGPIKNEQIYDQFFNHWHPLNNYSFDKINMLLYFQDVESEFSKQSKYKNISKKLYNNLMSEIEKIKDLRVNLSFHKDKKRYYIRGFNETWKLFRKISIPLITRLEIVENINENSKYKNYKINIIKIENNKKNPQISSKKKSNKGIKIKKQKNRSRSIPDELKDRVWRRDRGMCQANFRVDPNLDKNSGDICGSNEQLEFDHIVPFSKGGKTTYRNLQLLCQKHNRIKADRDI